jgi:outer membrane protein OmpA-like peptidoglycan-associated protein/tetratricopeptide (TPR) repeat protein
MSYFKIILLFVLIQCFQTNSIYAQTPNLQLTNAEKLYAKQDYYSAIPYYKAYLSQKKSNPEHYEFTGYLSKNSTTSNPQKVELKVNAMYQLAECFRKLYDYQNAEQWYDSVLSYKTINNYPLINYYYGVCLRANNKPNDAKKSFNQFLSKYKLNDSFSESAQLELNNIAFVEDTSQQPQRTKFTIEPISAINGDGSNFAPFKLGNFIYFTSTRLDSIDLKNNLNPYLHKLYTSSTQPNQKASLLFSINNENVHQGPASFTADGNTAFFTQWNASDNFAVGSIYIAHKQNGIWTNPKALDSNINAPGFTTQDPFVTADGKTLYFSSNKPGGNGNYDIWTATIQKDFSLNEITNLNNTVNTAGVEKAPYFNNTHQILVFASNNRIGYGGFDLYSSKKANNSFEKVQNLGMPINSIKDDLYFFAEEHKKSIVEESWVSSDRASSCCLSIFNIKQLPKPKNHLQGYVKNVSTNEAIAKASIKWVQENQNIQIQTNDFGFYEVIVPDTLLNTMTAFATSYRDTTEIVSHQFVEYADTLLYKDFYLTPIPVVSVDSEYFVYFDFNDTKLTSKATTTLDSLALILTQHSNWKIKIEGHTDGLGSDWYNSILSKKRATTVEQYFNQKMIDVLRISIYYFGKNQPIVPNQNMDGKDNPEARQINRRVKITIIK